VSGQPAIAHPARLDYRGLDTTTGSPASRSSWAARQNGREGLMDWTVGSGDSKPVLQVVDLNICRGKPLISLN
jgi:hypothetical protein